MNVHVNIKTVGGTLLLSTNKNTSRDTIVLFVPGMSGEAHTDRFQPLVDVSLAAGFPIARLEAWQGSEEANAHTYSHWQSIVKGAVNTLGDKGFTSVIAVGKSFGGGLLLSQVIPEVTKKILWAPAIGFGNTETLSTLRDQPAKNYKLVDIKLSPAVLGEETASVAIIHGDADTVVSVDNSQGIVDAVSSGVLTTVAGAGHSFDEPEHEQALMDHTARFLTE